MRGARGAIERKRERERETCREKERCEANVQPDVHLVRVLLCTDAVRRSVCDLLSLVPDFSIDVSCKSCYVQVCHLKPSIGQPGLLCSIRPGFAKVVASFLSQGFRDDEA